MRERQRQRLRTGPGAERGVITCMDPRPLGGAGTEGQGGGSGPGASDGEFCHAKCDLLNGDRLAESVG